MTLKVAISGLNKIERMIKFTKNIVVVRVAMPEIRDTPFSKLEDFLSKLALIAMPSIVANSAIAFVEAPTTSPLRMRIARKAMADVVAPEAKPKKSRDRTIGTPVKSNFRYGSHGKGIFRPKNFIK